MHRAISCGPPWLVADVPEPRCRQRAPPLVIPRRLGLAIKHAQKCLPILLVPHVVPVCHVYFFLYNKHTPNQTGSEAFIFFFFGPGLP